MITPEQIALILEEVLEKRAKIDAEIHMEHHEFIRTLIEKEQRKQALWDAVQKQVFGWGAVALIGFLGDYILSHLKGDITHLIK